MTQFTAPTPRRASGDLDVYTGLLSVAFLVLAVGVVVLAMANIKHSESRDGAGDGGMFELVQPR